MPYDDFILEPAPFGGELEEYEREEQRRIPMGMIMEEFERDEIPRRQAEEDMARYEAGRRTPMDDAMAWMESDPMSMAVGGLVGAGAAGVGLAGRAVPEIERALLMDEHDYSRAWNAAMSQFKKNKSLGRFADGLRGRLGMIDAPHELTRAAQKRGRELMAWVQYRPTYNHFLSTIFGMGGNHSEGARIKLIEELQDLERIVGPAQAKAEVTKANLAFRRSASAKAAVAAGGARTALGSALKLGGSAALGSLAIPIMAAKMNSGDEVDTVRTMSELLRRPVALSDLGDLRHSLVGQEDLVMRMFQDGLIDREAFDALMQ